MPNRKGWLDGLSVGDTVAYLTCHGDYSLARVLSITPSRTKFEVGIDGKWSRSMNRHGRTKPASCYSTGDEIVPMTTDILERILRDGLVEKVAKSDWRKLSTGALKQILEIVKSGG